MISATPENHWVELSPPPMPVSETSLPIFVVLLVIVLIAAVVAYVVYSRSRAKAKRSLKILGMKCRQFPTADRRACCVKIQQYLQTGLGVGQLKNLRFVHQQSWLDYLHKLERCRYSDEELAMQDLEAMIEQALLWLSARMINE